jgi:hypothetical protein
MAAHHDAAATRAQPRRRWRSPCRACRAAGVSAKASDESYRHRVEYALHAGSHVVDSDHLDLVVPQEPCHPGVMGSLGSLIVQRSPADGELLPVADLAVGHVGDRDAVGSSPSRVDLAISGDRHTHFQAETSLPEREVAGYVGPSPILDRRTPRGGGEPPPVPGPGREGVQCLVYVIGHRTSAAAS